MRIAIHHAGIVLALCTASAGVTAADAADAASQVITRAGNQTPTTGAATNFTGKVRVDPLTPANATINVPSAYVTFEPGARSAWHTHPAGQFLVVTAGKGMTQEWGKPVQELRVGDVVWCPPGVKHWHGAAPDSAMTHLALTGNQDGKSVTWMEQVSEAQYGSR